MFRVSYLKVVVDARSNMIKKEITAEFDRFDDKILQKHYKSITNILMRNNTVKCFESVMKK